MSVISEVKQEKNGTHLSDRERGRERNLIDTRTCSTESIINQVSVVAEK